MRAAYEIGPWSEAENDLGVFRQTNEDYHASEGISKSGLWTLWTECPAKYRFGEREEKSHFTFGQAAHDAILQPDEFEFLWHPVDAKTKAGKAWDAGVLEAHERGAQPLKKTDYEDVLRVRDSAGRNSKLQLFLQDAEIELSAFQRDPKTGVIVRVKPDFYSPKYGVIGDLKTTRSAKPRMIGRAMGEYGYNVQEPMYTDVWSRTGRNVEGFMFFFIESEAPFIVKPYELTKGAYQEGFAIYRTALEIYADCLRKNEWPAFGDEPEEIDIPAYKYELTKQPEPEPFDVSGLATEEDHNG